MPKNHEVLTWVFYGLLMLLVIGILVYPQGARHFHNPGPVDPNWRQQPYIRVRIALFICALILGGVGIFFATH